MSVGSLLFLLPAVAGRYGSFSGNLLCPVELQHTRSTGNGTGGHLPSPSSPSTLSSSKFDEAEQLVAVNFSTPVVVCYRSRL